MFIDNMDFNEGFQGYYTILDKNNKVIDEGHNLVTNFGRSAILNAFLGSSWLGNGTNGYDATSGYELYALMASNSTNETTLDYEFDANEYSNNKYKFVLPAKPVSSGAISTNDSLSLGSISWKIDAELGAKPSMTFTLDITFDDPDSDWRALTSIALVMKKDGAEPDYKLFSRFRMDPIPIDRGETLKLVYKIYV